MSRAPKVGQQYNVICPMCYSSFTFECTDLSVYGIPCTSCNTLVDMRNPSKTVPSGDEGKLQGGKSVNYAPEVEDANTLSTAAQLSVIINDVEKEKSKVLPKTMSGETKQAFAAQRSQAIAEKFYFFYPVTYAIEYLLFGTQPDAKIGHIRLFRKRIPLIGPVIFCVPKTSTSYAAPVTFVFFSILGFSWFCSRVVGEPWIMRWLHFEWVLVFFFYFFLCRLAYTDPGYIRPGYMDKTDNDAGEKTLKDIEKNQKESMWENVKGVPMERKWCSACEMYRPVRAAHCYLCGLCCYDHDHHCTVIGVCVGRRKCEMFTFFVSVASSACVIPSLTYMYSWYHYSKKMTTFQFYFSFILFIPLFFFSVMLTLTAVSMWQSLAMESSTRERIQGVYSNKRNPYNNGLVKNLIYHLCSRKIEPSIFDEHFVKECSSRFEKKDLGTGETVTCT